MKENLFGYSEFVAHMRFAYPAWDEKGGIYYTVVAQNARMANAFARRQSERDGHGGYRYFKVVKEGPVS